MASHSTRRRGQSTTRSRRKPSRCSAPSATRARNVAGVQGVYLPGRDRNSTVDTLGALALWAVGLGVVVHGLRPRGERPYPEDGMSPREVYVYKGFECFWHWMQAPPILFLALTGFEIHGSFSFLGSSRRCAITASPPSSSWCSSSSRRSGT